MKGERMRTPEPEPDLGPSKESIENGAEPADALYIDRGWLPDPPEPADPLDTAYGAAQARRQLAEALAAEPAPVITNPDPEATVDGVGCSERQLDAYLEWAGSQPLAEPEPDPELEAG
jgi:hypothetical protein